MSREHLFKGKRIDNGEWAEGCLATYPNGKARIFKTSSDSNAYSRLYDVDPETVCEDTGLRDENGNRIFENYILQGIASDGGIYRGRIIFNKGAFCYQEKDCSPDYFDNYDDMEVIGNIFDNPKLLEGGEGE
jgi:uncharacterized phage protein (TIGR01671 family)